MIELTNKTIQLINKLFFKKDRLEASGLLKYVCSDNLSMLPKSAMTEGNERIRFAAIKLSNGNLDELYYAVDLAQKDWRDLLMLSGFGEDLKAHEVWANNIID